MIFNFLKHFISTIYLRFFHFTSIYLCKYFYPFLAFQLLKQSLTSIKFNLYVVYFKHNLLSIIYQLLLLDMNNIVLLSVLVQFYSSASRLDKPKSEQVHVQLALLHFASKQEKVIFHHWVEATKSNMWKSLNYFQGKTLIFFIQHNCLIHSHVLNL